MKQFLAGATVVACIGALVFQLHSGGALQSADADVGPSAGVQDRYPASAAETFTNVGTALQGTTTPSRAAHANFEVDDAAIPEDVRARIASLAAYRHPDDYSTQLYVIRNETDAYRELQDLSCPADVPDEVFRGVSSRAADRHPNDYSTQIYLMEQQLQSYRKLRVLQRPADVPEETFRAILTRAAERHPHDFSTQVYVIENELSAYQQLRRQ